MADGSRRIERLKALEDEAIKGLTFAYSKEYNVTRDDIEFLVRGSLQSGMHTFESLREWVGNTVPFINPERMAKIKLDPYFHLKESHPDEHMYTPLFLRGRYITLNEVVSNPDGITEVRVMKSLRSKCNIGLKEAESFISESVKEGIIIGEKQGGSLMLYPRNISTQ